jgi:hypothetical protein
MQASANAFRFFVCNTPFVNRAGRLGIEMSALFRNPENTERAKARCAALAEGVSLTIVFPPLPVYMIEVVDDTAVVSKRVAGTMLPEEAKDQRRLYHVSPHYGSPRVVPTHETCFDKDVWQESERIPASDLAAFLPELADPTCPTGHRKLPITFVWEGKTYFNGASRNPAEFRAYLADFVRQT